MLFAIFFCILVICQDIDNWEQERIMNPLLLGIAGASGRLGRCIVAAALDDSGVKVVSGLGSPHSPYLKEDLGILADREQIGTYLVSDPKELFQVCDLVIDVSLATNLAPVLNCAVKEKKPIVIGTTGHDESNLLLIQKASQEIPIFFTSNFSLGIAAMSHALSILTNMSGLRAPITIEETHHPQKKDTPSGTALHLAETIFQASGQKISSIKSYRENDAIGKHVVTFSLENEEISIHHRALSRTLFAKGALRAAKFLACQSAGLYSMRELLQEDVYAPSQN